MIFIYSNVGSNVGTLCFSGSLSALRISRIYHSTPLYIIFIQHNSVLKSGVGANHSIPPLPLLKTCGGKGDGTPAPLCHH